MTSAFESEGVTPITSLNIDLERYRHKRTGARHYHLRSDDSNNAFLVAFLTMPEDSTGVAHILEHTSLCGSARFPVRDPFFGMLKRSLQTFMNAFTASDWTAYPFATQNPKDFDNLLQVYLDAAFFPKLSELDFAQEGHRLELEDPHDSASPLTLKGVVYNEMKGAMSPPVSQVHQALNAHLFPTITYHYNSGGDPEEIPTLTHAGLKAFHERHYHPSNAVFMTYGNFPVEHHHARFEELALGRFERIEHGLSVPDERRYAKPIAVEAEFAVDGDEHADETHVVFGWLLGRSADLGFSLRAQLLSSILLEHSGSPLRAALETTPLGAAPSELCGLDDESREATFVVGLEGTRAEHADAIETLVMDVLREVAEHDVPRSEVESSLHQLELGQREVSGDHFPYGLNLMVRALGTAIHGSDPAQSLDIDSELEKLRTDSAEPGFVSGLVREMLLDNPHRVRMTMRPSRALTQSREERLRERLRSLRAGMSAEALARIQQQAEALEALQNAPDDSHLLPSVGIDDIPEDIHFPVPENRTLRATPVAWFDGATNGLVYVQVVTDMPRLDPALDLHLPLFCDLLPEVGAAERDYRANQAWQVAVTGGISASNSLRCDRDDPSIPQQHFVLRGKALARNSAHLVKLLGDTLARARFDEPDRLREIISQLRAHEEARLTDAGHVFAMSAANDGLTATGTINERHGGLTAVKALKALDASLAVDADALAAFRAACEDLRDQFARASRQIAVVSEKARFGDIEAALDTELPLLPDAGAAVEARPLALTAPVRDVAWVINSQVNFCAKVFLATAHSHRDAPALAVLAHLLRTGFLHREIREKGGAYGGGASYDPNSGTFGFYSYRDPRLVGTLRSFDEAAVWAHDAVGDDALRSASILGVVGAMDRPGSPAGEAFSAYHNGLHGRDPAFLRALRSGVLDVGSDDLRRVIDTHLHPSAGRVAVVTSRRALDDAGDDFDADVREL